MLVLYLILTSESVKNQAATSLPAANNQTAPASLADSYRPQVKELFASFEVMARDNSFTKEKIFELKNKLLGLKVPAEFKQLHLNFVQLLDKVEGEQKSAGLQTANQLKADYSWLNN